MNLQNQWVKGLLMIILTTLLAIFTKFPENGTQWLVIGLTTVGTIAVYLAQSNFFPASSESGQINARDIFKGLLVAAGNAISTFVAELSTGTAISWKALFLSMGGLFVSYLIKNLLTPAPKA